MGLPLTAKQACLALNPVGCLPLSQGGVHRPSGRYLLRKGTHFRHSVCQQKIHILKEGGLVTTRKRTLAKVSVFARVCHSVQWTRYHASGSGWCTSPLGADTPPGARHIPTGAGTPPWTRYTPSLDQVYPLDQAHPPCMLGDTGHCSGR